MENKQKNSKAKNILNVILDVFIVLFLLFSTVILVFSLSQKAEEPGGKPSQIFGYSIRSVQSNSMEPYKYDGTKFEHDNAFYKGDLIFCKVTDESDTYEIGDAVMFWMYVNQDGSQAHKHHYYTKVLTTHQIVDIVEVDGETQYVTQGLNEKVSMNADLLNKTADEFVAKYNGKRIGGMGKVVDFVKSGLGFFLCIILPILIFVVIQTIRVIRNFIAYKAQKAAAVVASGELTEEQKRLIAEEYLKQQTATDSNATPSTDEVPADEDTSVEEENPAE